MKKKNNNIELCEKFSKFYTFLFDLNYKYIFNK